MTPATRPRPEDPAAQPAQGDSPGPEDAAAQPTPSTRPEDSAVQPAPSGRAAGEAPLRRRLKFLPSGLLASAAVLAVGVVIAALVRGAAPAWGMAAGVGLVAASYTLSSLAIAWADSVNPRLVLVVGLVTYVVKFTLIGVLMIAVSATGWSGLPAMGLGIIASVIAWTTAQAWWTWHGKFTLEFDGK